MFNITDNAKNKIADLFYEENNPNIKLRMFVQGGGCAGFSYGFMFDTDTNEDDFEFESGPTKVLVDGMSMQYVNEATIDYVEELMGSSFKIINPAAVTTCGCGSSFSV